jgi:threonine synthase
MKYVSTRTPDAPGVSFTQALFDGLAPDGGLYVPKEPSLSTDLAVLPSPNLGATGTRVIEPFLRGELPPGRLRAIVDDALDFEIPIVEVEPDVYALELFHGPTLAFKDVGARVMARLMSALFVGDDSVTVLVATSGDTGSAVAHAFQGVPHTRVVVLYPDGRVSPTQEAQLTMFNDQPTNVRAYAIAGNFDDCQRIVKAAFSHPELAARLTSANSINVGRLIPQMVYYAHAVAQLANRALPAPVFSTPSGNFGNLTAGLMMKRVGLPVDHFVAATNVNDVVPEYLTTGRYEPRASIHTLASAMDVGNPSNFDRMMWLYGNDLSAIRRDVVGSRHDDREVAETIRRVYGERGYLLDPHSAIAYMGLKEDWARRRQEGREGQDGSEKRAGVFLATAHPAKFPEIVEPILGREIQKPPALAEALARERQILRLPATLESVRDVLFR